jgi:gliding motility-associated-like protein
MTDVSPGTSGQSVSPSISIFNACPGTGSCMAGSTGFVSAGAVAVGPSVGIDVKAGQCYYVVIDEAVSGQSACVNFTLSSDFFADVVQPSCANMGFENGLNNWVPNYGSVTGGPVGSTIPVYNRTAVGLRSTPRHTIVTGGTDPCGGFNRVFSGSSSLQLGDQTTGSLGEQIKQTFKVSKSNASFTYNYAVVLQDPQHTDPEQPFFKALLYDQKGNVIPCSPYIVTAGPNAKGFVASSCASTFYKNWSTVNVDLSNYIGQDVTVEFTVGDCTQGGHYGYAYVDAQCGPSLLKVNNDTICLGQSTTLVSPPGYDSYLWNPGGFTTANITVSPTTTTVYTQTLTSANGCKQSFPDTVWVEPNITLQASQVNAGCGACNGSLSVIPKSGSAPYAYTWGSGGITGNSGSGLCAGAYSVTVSSASGCTGSTIVTITSGGGLNLTPSVTNATCFGKCNGGASVTIIGGVAPYNYTWSNNQTASSATGLCAGAYVVTVSDANGCSSTQTLSITEPTALTATPVNTDELCPGGNTATAGITTGGGVTPYAYLWNNTKSTSNITGLIKGTYTVSITDASGCTVSQTITITEPTPLTTNSSSTVATCGATNGSATINVLGGTAPYGYFWFPAGGGQSTPTAVGLSAGVYTCNITDANNCTTTGTATVLTTNGPVAALTGQTNLLCFGDVNATATVGVTSGGVSPFTYLWDAVAKGQTTATATNLYVGTYTCTVTDNSGCTASATVTITQPPLLTASTTKVDVLCFGGNNGSATASAAGGTSPYDFLWDNTQATVTATNLKAGTYIVTATDANNCTTTQNVTITEPPALVTAPSNTNELCFGGNTANATVTPGGGTSPYVYQWDNSQTSAMATGLIAGIYICTVTDANTCTVSQAVTITEPPALSETNSFTQATCGMSNGSATESPGGGTSPYVYLWDASAASQTTATALSLAAGTYTCTITDANSCTLTGTVTVPQAPIPIPTTTGTDVSCFGGNDGTATVTPNGTAAPFTFLWSDLQTSATAVNLILGTYTVTVTDGNSCTATQTVNLTQPTPVTLSVSPQVKICIGQSATLTATAGGGTTNYIYDWTPNPQTGASVNVSPSVKTTYTVIMTDAKGCSISSTVIVDVTPPLNVTAINGKMVCLGGSTTVSATAVGGDGNYTYSWLPVNLQGTTISVTPNGIETYTVTVSDGCGTPVSTAIATAQGAASLLTPAFSPDSASGCVPLCVSFKNVTTGGITKGCSWTFGDGGASKNCSPTYCYRKPGVYSVKLTVIDTNGCVSFVNSTGNIKVYPMPVAGFTLDPKSTSILTPTITFTDKSSSDVVKWNWSFGAPNDPSSGLKNPQYTYLDTGRYDVKLIVTNPWGCTDTATDYVIIHGDYMFYVPNAFTPNGDGKNETFFPKGFMINPVCYKMLIFDRWGNMIFQTNSLDIGWDGRANGGEHIAQQDVYSWKIETCDYADKKYQYIGHVTLVR